MAALQSAVLAILEEELRGILPPSLTPPLLGQGQPVDHAEATVAVLQRLRAAQISTSRRRRRRPRSSMTSADKGTSTPSTTRRPRPCLLQGWLKSSEFKREDACHSAKALNR